MKPKKPRRKKPLVAVLTRREFRKNPALAAKLADKFDYVCITHYGRVIMTIMRQKGDLE